MTVYWAGEIEEIKVIGRCYFCKKSVDIEDSMGLDPIYCADCVRRWEKVQRAWGTILIVLAIVVYLLSVTIGPKLVDWNWPAL